MSNVVTSRGWFNIGRVAVNTEPCSARTRLTMSFITKPITIIIRFNIIISKTFDIIISGLFSWHILYPLVGGSQAVWAELRSSFPAHTHVTADSEGGGGRHRHLSQGSEGVRLSARPGHVWCLDPICLIRSSRWRREWGHPITCYQESRDEVVGN